MLKKNGLTAFGIWAYTRIPDIVGMTPWCAQIELLNKLKFVKKFKKKMGFFIYMMPSIFCVILVTMWCSTETTYYYYIVLWLQIISRNLFSLSNWVLCWLMLAVVSALSGSPDFWASLRLCSTRIQGNKYV